MTSLTLIAPHLKDLGGGFNVRRSLPAAQRQSVGPFLFFDHFGPVTETPGSAHDVRPHPHIGLATVTYLFEGAICHRDSLGNAQRIEPGAINLMTAGKGIVHSERKPSDLLESTYTSHGLQLWLGLPLAMQECEPAFAHTAAADIPAVDVDGCRVRVLMGKACGVASPVKTFDETLYLDLQMAPGQAFTLPDVPPELAIYCVDQGVLVNGEPVSAHVLCVVGPGQPVRIEAPQGVRAVRVVMIGGAPLDGGHRFMWWNFVSSSKERIEQAKADWAAQRMGQVPGEHEWIPLPTR
ncbi:MAG: pirin family protein [Aquabacterium sp.]